MKSISLILIFLPCVLSVSGQSNSPTKRYFYGTVLEVNGAAVIAAESKNSIRVVKDMLLYGKQSIECQNKKSDCVIKVNKCDLRTGSIVVGPGSRRLIPSVDCKPPTEEFRNLRTGGRNDVRSKGGAFYSPSDLGLFRPHSFAIRWKPYSPGIILNLSIQDETGITRWKDADVDGRKGSYISNSLQLALKKEQHEERLNLILTVEIHQKFLPRRYEEIRFTLISEEAQKALENELAMWDGESGVMRNLGRAAIFSTRNLFVDSAKEFEKALRLSWSDVELVRATISAESYATDDNRVIELCQRLRKLDPQQDHCSCTNRCIK